MAYLLDANVFIQAKNLHYGFDFCPAFWDWVDAANRDQKVFSVEKVGAELFGYGDELASWAEARSSDSFFLKPDTTVVTSLQAISTWASGAGHALAAVNTFLQSADYYLVAHALAYGHLVVTHEKFSATTKKIQIPNACIDLDVRCMTPFEMLRIERARFIIG